MLKYKLIYFSLLTVLLIGLNLFLPRYYQATFVIRHVVIFIYVSSVIIIGVKALYEWFKTRYDHILKGTSLRLFKSFTIIFIGLLLWGTTIIQNEYIERYESAREVERCYYFDAYGNYVHGSTISFHCPELEVIEQNDERFIFQVIYNVDTVDQEALEAKPYSPLKEGYIMVDVSVEYGEENIITNYTNQTSRQYAINQYDSSTEEHQVEKYYDSVYIKIDNDFDSDPVIQRKIGDHKHKNVYENDHVDDFNHYDFELEDPFVNHEITLFYDQNEENITFEIHNKDLDIPLQYEGFIEDTAYYRELMIETNPESLNSDPPIYEKHIQIYDDLTIVDKYEGDDVFGMSYHVLRDTLDMIHFSEDNEVIVENTIYEREDFSISEGNFGTFRMDETEFGYQMKHYRYSSKNTELTPKEAAQEFRVELMNPDMNHFDYNPIRMIYRERPWLELNPLFEYLLNKMVTE